MQAKEAKSYLRQVPAWQLGKTPKGMDMISVELKFKDFKHALAFVNLVGKIAEKEGHHPNIEIYSWNRVRLVLYTHAIGGLSTNDFIMAAKINQKLQPSRHKR